MKHLFILCLYFHSVFNVCAQQKKINLCASTRFYVVAKEFRIPNAACTVNNKNLNALKEQIRKKFEINGTFVSMNAFLIEGNTYAEALYKSKKCDTLAILYLFDKKKRLFYSDPYRLQDGVFDFRWEKSQGNISLYRRIKKDNKGRVTAKFQYDEHQKMIHRSVEDGHSKWGSVVKTRRIKKTISLCDIMALPGTTKLVDIPKTKSTIQNKNISTIKSDITAGCSIDGTMIRIKAFSAYDNTFAEVLYKTKKCDTVALLFHWEKGEGCTASRPYKIFEGVADFRMSKSNGRINLYRKVGLKGKKHTASFAYDMKKDIIDSYLYNGVNKW
ncbi:hypothetical protein SIO70_15550 [Chitinophaga sancti]|uniref:hypothetical protein n=1 Tax=Chitinophaga sancti TaxID=1004 RepID=UPI002A751F50|nr:hypothetical protein [Chitinophaga sancti]WPQ66275.1 hypothetical protein SIO70_15550 [Chitinophaga sancti]